MMSKINGIIHCNHTASAVAGSIPPPPPPLPPPPPPPPSPPGWGTPCGGNIDKGGGAAEAMAAIPPSAAAAAAATTAVVSFWKSSAIWVAISSPLSLTVKNQYMKKIYTAIFWKFGQLLMKFFDNVIPGKVFLKATPSVIKLVEGSLQELYNSQPPLFL